MVIDALKQKVLMFLAMTALAVAVGTTMWAVVITGKANVLEVKHKAAEADLTKAKGTIDVLMEDAKARAKVDAVQATQKAQATAAVTAVRTETNKEKANDETPRAVAGPSQLDRLRRLAAAGNDAVRDASKLPGAAQSNP